MRFSEKGIAGLSIAECGQSCSMLRLLSKPLAKPLDRKAPLCYNRRHSGLEGRTAATNTAATNAAASSIIAHRNLNPADRIAS
jgi:hypothetical protein